MSADALFTGPLSGYRDLRCGTLEAAPLNLILVTRTGLRCNRGYGLRPHSHQQSNETSAATLRSAALQGRNARPRDFRSRSSTSSLNKLAGVPRRKSKEAVQKLPRPHERLCPPAVSHRPGTCGFILKYMEAQARTCKWRGSFTTGMRSMTAISAPARSVRERMQCGKRVV